MKPIALFFGGVVSAVGAGAVCATFLFAALQNENHASACGVLVAGLCLALVGCLFPAEL